MTQAKAPAIVSEGGGDDGIELLWGKGGALHGLEHPKRPPLEPGGIGEDEERLSLDPRQVERGPGKPFHESAGVGLAGERGVKEHAFFSLEHPSQVGKRLFLEGGEVELPPYFPCPAPKGGFGHGVSLPTGSLTLKLLECQNRAAMPVYVYKGLETGKYYEFEQGFHDEPLKAHPETGEPLKRVIQAPAIIFKGSGWHSTDYRKGKSASEKKSEGEKKSED